MLGHESAHIHNGFAERGARMPVRAACSFAFLIMLVGATDGSGETGGVQMLLDVKPSHVSFGSVLSGEKAEKVIMLRNKASSPIWLHTVRSSCGCMTTDLEAQAIPAGGSLEFKCVLDTTGRVGPYKGNIALVLGRDHDEIQNVSVDAKIYSSDNALYVHPQEVYAGQLKPREESARKLVIARTSGAAIGALSPRISGDTWIEAQVVPTSSANMHELRVLVTVPPDATGVLRGEIRLVGEDEEDFVRIPVTCVVPPAIRAAPEIVLLRSDKTEYVIDIHSRDGAIPIFVEHKWSGKGVDVTAVRWDDNRAAFSVSVHFQPNWTAVQEGELRLFFKDAPAATVVKLIGLPSRR